MILALAIASITAPIRAAADEGAWQDAGRTHYQRGQALYQKSQFDAALSEFRAAYEASADAAYLIDVAKCQGRLHQYDSAIFFYQGYLTWVPEGPQRAEVERAIAEMQAARAATAAAGGRGPRNKAVIWVPILCGAVVVAGGALALGFLLNQSALPSDTLGTIDARTH